MEKGLHIALTVESLQIPKTRSFRRTWNQLPRCQRNLIILGILAACTIYACLYLPGDPLIHNKKFPGTIEVVPDSADDALLERTKTAEHNHEEAEMEEQMKIDREALKRLNVGKETAENGMVIPIEDVDQNLDHVPDPIADNKVNIKESNPNDNNIEPPAPALVDDRTLLTQVVRNPNKLPGINGLSIDEFLERLDNSEAQKQHFHGATNERQTAVVAAFRHSWENYQKFAWGHDNLKPISRNYYDWFSLGLTIIDSLDTMYIMGLEDEFLEARRWVDEHLKFDIERDVNLFEVTIRVLGGLLATYHLSGDKMFLKKSIEVGNRLLPCFLSPSGIPYSDANFGTMTAHSPKWSPDSSTSEVTTIQMEFRDLSRVTSVNLYENVVNVVNEKVHALPKNNGLVPIFINALSGKFRNYSTVSLGARGDSYYEYLLKQWIQTGRKVDDNLVLDYIRSIDGVLTKLMRRTPKQGHVYIGELLYGKGFKPKMDHLTCYLPGTLLLGHKYGMPDSHLILAKDLLETCYQTYMQHPTHLAPEISYFAENGEEENDIYVKPNDAHNLQRPEFIESLYYFYALTGNRSYQDMGWNIFQAFEKHTRVAQGYTSINDVRNVLNTRPRDLMESYWMGETLKYFYLLFSDNRKEIDLDKWIFNTEAHPLPIRNN